MNLEGFLCVSSQLRFYVGFVQSEEFVQVWCLSRISAQLNEVNVSVSRVHVLRVVGGVSAFKG